MTSVGVRTVTRVLRWGRPLYYCQDAFPARFYPQVSKLAGDLGSFRRVGSA